MSRRRQKKLSAAERIVGAGTGAEDPQAQRMREEVLPPSVSTTPATPAVEPIQQGSDISASLQAETAPGAQARVETGLEAEVDVPRIANELSESYAEDELTADVEEQLSKTADGMAAEDVEAEMARREAEEAQLRREFSGRAPKRLDPGSAADAAHSGWIEDIRAWVGEENQRNAPRPEGEEDEEDEPGVLDTAKVALEEGVMLGVLATPAIAGAALDVVDNFVSGIGDLYNWATQNDFVEPDLEAMGLDAGSTLEEIRAATSENFFHKVAKMVPDIPESDYKSVQLLRGFARFLVPFVALGGPAGALVRGIGLGTKAAKMANAARLAGKEGAALQVSKEIGKAGILAKGALQGAAADTLQLAEENITTMLLGPDGLDYNNAVLGWIVHDDDDTKWEKLAKNAIEGTVLGVFSDVIALGLKAGINARRARNLNNNMRREEMLTRRIAIENGEEPPPISKEAMAEVEAEYLQRHGRISQDQVHSIYKTALDSLNTRLDAEERVAQVSREIDEQADVTLETASGETVKVKTPEASHESRPARGARFNLEKIFMVGSDDYGMNEFMKDMLGEVDQTKLGLGRQSQQDIINKANNPIEKLSLSELLALGDGQVLNSVQSLEARRLMASMGKYVFELKNLAKSGGNAEMFAFRQASMVYKATAESVLQVRAEAGRLLNSWKIIARSDIEMAKAVSDILDFSGGTGMTKKMMRNLDRLELEMAGRDGFLDDIIVKGLDLTAFQKFEGISRELATLAPLWSLKTHGKNNTGTGFSVFFMEQFDRWIAGGLSHIRGDLPGNKVYMGEAAARWVGMTSSVKAAYESGYNRLWTGESAVHGLTSSKLDIPRESIFNQINTVSATSLGRKFDPIRRGFIKLGKLHAQSGNALMAADEFYTYLAYQGDLHALAFRRAMDEQHIGLMKGKSGTTDPEFIKQRMLEIVRSQPKDLVDQAIKTAKRSTFTDREHGQHIAGLLRLQRAPFMYNIATYVSTPASVFRNGVKHTPLVGLLLKDVRADIMAGGARRAQAEARMVAGAMTMSLVFEPIMNGDMFVEGPSSRGQKSSMLQHGHRMHSIVIDKEVDGNVIVNGKVYDVGVAEQLLPALAAMGRMGEIYKYRQIDGDDAEAGQIMADLASVFIHGVIAPSFAANIADFMKATSDPKGKGLGWLVHQRAQQHKPFVGLAKNVESFVDPAIRMTTGNRAWDIFRAMTYDRIPGLESRLPIKPTWLGEERVITKPYLAGFTTTELGSDFAYTETRKLELYPEPPRLKQKARYKGVPVTLEFKNYPQAYSDMVRFQGTMWKFPHNRKTLKETLNDLKTDEWYLALPEIGKKKVFQTYIGIARSEGRRVFLDNTSKDSYPLLNRFLDSERDRFMTEHGLK